MTHHPAAIAAATWWAQQVGAPRFDNGDRSDNGGMATMLATHLAHLQTPSDDAYGRFIEALATGLDAEIQRGAETGRPLWLTLDVDYGPDMRLGRAAEVAGISSSRFPWKTTMWVHLDHVVVSAGYQGASILIWHSEDYQRPLCISGKYSADYAYRLPWTCGLPQYHATEGVVEHDFTLPDPVCSECGRPKEGHGPNEGLSFLGHTEFTPGPVRWCETCRVMPVHVERDVDHQHRFVEIPETEPPT